MRRDRTCGECRVLQMDWGGGRGGAEEAGRAEAVASLDAFAGVCVGGCVVGVVGSPVEGEAYEAAG